MATLRRRQRQADSERATLRVGDVFLKIDSDQARTDMEVKAMAIEVSGDVTN